MFAEIADQILNRSVLTVKDTKYRICEIEMYLHSSDHPDHCHSDQMENSKFYFHKFKNGTFKAGTFKGLDIVYGRENVYFGILIRSIEQLDTGKFVEGSCNCVITI